MNKCKMYLVVESYDCYNVSEDTWSYVRYLCCNDLFIFGVNDSNHVFIRGSD